MDKSFHEKLENLFGTEVEGYSSKYKLLDFINDGDEGANGVLLKVSNKDGKIFAMKVLQKNNNDKTIRFNDEYKFQSESKNAYIVKALDYGSFKLSKKSKDRFFYVIEMYNCNYTHLIHSDKSEYVSSNEKKLKYILQLCKAIKYMHKRKVIHRDLKPENILYDKKYDKVLIGDFGIAHFKKGNKTSKNDNIGNYDYHAPEQKKNGTKLYGTYTDIYSLGLIINETFTGEIPCGTNYKKVADVYPPFNFLDFIISTMIVQDYKFRENDIKVIINKINIEMERLNDFNEEVKGKIDVELINKGKSVSKKLKEQIFSDINIANKFFSENIFQVENINLYYHENISYKLKPFVFNCYIQFKIYNIILNKFFYESETGFENNDPIDLNKDKELIEKFDFLIQKYHTLDKFEYYSKKSKKLFINLKKYHAIEVFTNIKNEIQKANENLLNAPILWMYFFLCKEEFIIELKELYDNSTICDFVEFNYEKISEKIEIDELYIKNHSETEEFVKKLKEIYHSIVIIDDENFTISKKDHQLLINYYNEKFKDDESIFCGDIIDFFNSAQIRNNVFQYKIESYQIRSLKEFLFNEYDSEIDE